jgi:hypothetical protein
MPSFLCRACGREVFPFAPQPDDPSDLCAHCVMFPGWRDDPALARLLDPGAATRRSPAEAQGEEGRR